MSYSYGPRRGQGLLDRPGSRGRDTQGWLKVSLAANVILILGILYLNHSHRLASDVSEAITDTYSALKTTSETLSGAHEKYDELGRRLKKSRGDLQTILSQDTHSLVTRPPWLSIALPIYAKPEIMKDVWRALEPILMELPTKESDPFFGSIRINILNTNDEPEAHAALDSLELMAHDELQAPFDLFVFTETVEGALHALGKTPLQALLAAPKLATAMVLDKAQHVLLVEDFPKSTLCPHAIRTLHYMLEKMAAMEQSYEAVAVSNDTKGILLTPTSLINLAGSKKDLKDVAGRLRSMNGVQYQRQLITASKPKNDAETAKTCHKELHGDSVFPRRRGCAPEHTDLAPCDKDGPLWTTFTLAFDAQH